MTPYDEPRIESSECIIRRINPEHHIVWDDNIKGNRISSKAFKPSSAINSGMSVDIEGLITKNGIDPKNFVTTPKYTGSVCFAALDIRKLNLWLGYHPVTENPYHGEVWGVPKPNRFTKSQSKELAKCAVWYVEIQGVTL